MGRDEDWVSAEGTGSAEGAGPARGPDRRLRLLLGTLRGRYVPNDINLTTRRLPSAMPIA